MAVCRHRNIDVEFEVWGGSLEEPYHPDHDAGKAGENNLSLWGSEPIARVYPIHHVTFRVVLRPSDGVGEPVHNLEGFDVGQVRLRPPHEDDTAGVSGEVVEKEEDQR